MRVDGGLARSCLMFAVQLEGANIETVEGLASGDELHPVQQAYHEQHGLQCGYCTPGLLLASIDLLERSPDPSEEEIREYLQATSAAPATSASSRPCRPRRRWS